MGQRVVLAGVLGAVGMFVWSSIAHMALPLGEAGVKQITNERPVLSAMQTALGQTSGFYLFPELTNRDMEAYAKKLTLNPSGLLIYHPAGTSPSIARQLITEFLAELAMSFLAVILLARARIEGFGARLGFVAVIGLLASLCTNIQYWNWYGFPVSYTLSYMFTMFVGFIVAGAIAAKLLRSAPKASAAYA